MSIVQEWVLMNSNNYPFKDCKISTIFSKNQPKLKVKNLMRTLLSTRSKEIEYNLM